MSDLISRQDAIERLREFANDDMTSTAKAIGADYCVDLIRIMPSAEPERKRGKWQRRKGSDCWECSKCHAVLESDDIVRHNFYYCYHCGTDMTNEDGYIRLEGTEHE